MMLLKNKVAVIYGAGGAIGGAVAHAFAAEGARVFLTGRHRAPVEIVAKDDSVVVRCKVSGTHRGIGKRPIIFTG